MKLYSMPGTCATAIHIALEWIGIPFEVEHLNMQKSKTPEYLKLNPQGVVPTLVDDGKSYCEAAAILLYLTDRFPDSQLGPGVGDVGRAEFYRWLIYISGTLHPNFWPYFMPKRFTTNKVGHSQVREASQTLVDKALTVIDNHLADRSYILGNEKTVADALLYPMASWAYGFAKPTSEYVNVDALVKRIAKDPGVLRVHEIQGTQPKF